MRSHPGSPMKSLSALMLFASLALAACGAPATIATAPVPAVPTQPAVVAPPAGPAIQVPRVTLSEAPRNWQLLDGSADQVPGISVERAYRELLVGKSPKQAT